MNRTRGLVAAAVMSIGVLSAQQPKIGTTPNSVVNAVSFIPAGLPNSGIAQGSLFSIFGTNMAPSPAVQAASYPLQTSLGETSVKVTVNGVSKDAYISFAGALQGYDQINAILPSDTPVGTGTVTVTYKGQTSAPAPITVVRTQPGITAWSSRGSGGAAATNAKNEFVTLTNSVRPNDVIVLWATGLGPVDPATEATRPPAPFQPSVPVKVFIGGKEASVSYAARSGFTAEDQINVQVPAGVDGCFVPVVVQAADALSNYVTIPVSANGGACSDPLSFTAQELQRAQQSGTYRTGSIVLSRIAETLSVLGVPIGGTTDTANATFAKYDYSRLVGSTGVNSGQLSVSTLGSCSVYTFSGSALTLPTDLVAPDPLDAGTLTITGPKGSAQVKAGANTPGTYLATLGGGISIPLPGLPQPTPLFLEPGSYTIDNGGGGSGPNAVGHFNVAFTLPPFITWSNMDAINAVTRSQGVDVTWSGGDANTKVIISGTSVTSTANGLGSGFVCVESATAGHFFIKPEVLLALPPSAPNNLTDFGGIMFVTGGNVQATFTATGLDKGTVLVDGGNAKPVSFK